MGKQYQRAVFAITDSLKYNSIIMRTPAGNECEFYYEDFNRGREIQECRLIKQNPASELWEQSLCQKCAVPEIRRANRCPDMILTATVTRYLFFWKRVKITAFCLKTQQPVAEPKVGCGECMSDHPGTKFWEQVLSEE